MTIINIENLPNADPFPLGNQDKWSTKEKGVLLANGAFMKDHKIFIDQAKLSGTVPLGLTERRYGHLRIKGTKVHIRYGNSRGIE